MRKRIMSLILAIAMIFAMVPEMAFASNTGGTLKCREAGFEYDEWGAGIPVEDLSAELVDQLAQEEWDSKYLYFYFEDAEGNVTNVTDNLKSADNSILNLYKYGTDNPCMVLTGQTAGETTVDYTHTDGTVYSMPVRVTSFVEPTQLHILDAPSLSEGNENYSFVITDTENQFYLVLDEGWEFTSVTLDNELLSIASVEISESRTYATVTVNGRPQGYYYGLNFEAEYVATGKTHSSYMSVELINGRPSLKCSFVNDASGLMSDGVWGTVGNTEYYYFYCVDENGTTAVPASDLSVMNSDILTITPDFANSNIAMVTFNKAGYTSISYNGMTMSVTVNDSMTGPGAPEGPYLGFYRDMAGTMPVTDFAISGTETQFYLVATGGMEITKAELAEESKAYATITIDSKTCATIKITDVTFGGKYMGNITVIYAGTDGTTPTEEITCTINAYNNNNNTPIPTPSLQCMMPGDASGMLYTGIEMVEGSKVTYKFYYVDPSNPAGNTEVPITDLKVADESIVTILQNSIDPSAVDVSFNMQGSTIIYYMVGTETYSVNVTVMAPQGPSLTGKSLVFHWLKSNEDAEFEYDANGNYIPDEEGTPCYELRMTTESVSPVVFYFLDLSTYAKQRLSFNDLGITTSNITLREEKGAVIIDATKANIGDEAYITAFDEETKALYRFHVIVDAPVPVPAVGYYATADATTPIQNFTVTSTDNVFYFIATDNWTFTKMKLYDGSENYANVSLDATKKIATVTITDPTLCGNESVEFCLLYSATDGTQSGNNFQEHIIVSQPAKPKLMFAMGMWNENNQFEEDPNAFLSSADRRTPGYSADYFFYMVDGENRIPVYAGDLTSSNKNVVTVSTSDMNPYAVRINPLTFGSAKIQYTYNGTVYSVDINVELPMFGFYNTTTASQSSFISEFKLTDSNDTFYLLPDNADNKFATVTLNPDFAQIATATLSEDGSYVIIKVTGNPSDGRSYNLSFTYTSANMPSTMPMNGMASIMISDSRSGLKFRYPAWNNGMPVEDRNYQLNSVVNGTLGGSDPLYIYYVTSNGEMLLNASDLESSDESIVKLSVDSMDGNAVRLDYLKVGTVTINYRTYSMDVVVDLPPFGFYSTPTASAESYIRDFTVTDENNTFYFIARNGWTFKRVETLNNLTDIASVDLDESGTVAKITVTGTPTQGHGYEILYDAWHEGMGISESNRNYGITLVNGKPSLMMGFGSWNGNSFVENTNNAKTSSYSSAPGRSNDVFFYLVENEEIITRVSISDLKSMNEDILALEQSPLNENAIRMNPVAFGNTKINYTHTDGKVYSFDVSVELPMIGFYSDKTASQSSYISEFTLTSNEDTFYLLPNGSGYTFNSVTLDDDFGKIATATISDDNSYVTIKVTGTPANGRYYTISYNYTYENNGSTQTWNNSYSILLKDGRPSLMMNFGSWDNNDNYSENLNNQMMNSYTATIGSRNEVFFYYVEGENVTRLSFDQLTSSNKEVLTIGKASSSADAVCINPLTFGDTKISYTHTDGKTYSMDIVVDLPLFGYYTSPTASKADYIQGFTVTDTADTFYLVARDGWSFENLTLVNEFGDIATYTLSQDKTYVTIKVNKAPIDGQWYRVIYDCVHTSGSTIKGNGVGIQLFDAMPGLKFQWPDFMGESNEHSEMYTYLDTAKGYATDVWVYYFDGTNYNKLTWEDLYCSNDVMSFAQAQGTEDMVTLQTNDWGSAEVCYDAPDGKTYSFSIDSRLQDFGFYTKKEISKDNWLVGTFTVTDTAKTFYLMSQNGRVMNDVQLVGDAALEAVIEVTDNNTCVKVTFVGNPESGTYLALEFTSPNGDGTKATCHYGINIENAICQHPSSTLVGQKDATCTEDGYTGDKVCETCDKMLEEGTVIKAIGHTEVTEGQKDATCTEAGHTGNKVCSVCKEVLEKGTVIEALGHTEVTEGQKDATCTEAGYTGDKVCSVCKVEVEKGSEIAALGHTEVIEGQKDATCTEAGYTGDKVCSVCKVEVEKGSEIAALGHTEVTEGQKDATCTEAGYTGDKVCSACKEVFEKGTVIKALGHTEVTEGQRAATCVEDGYTGDKVCSTCKEVLEKGTVIEAAGHKEIVVDKKAVTCTVDGYTGDKVCDTCKAVLEKGMVLKAGHNYVDYVCTACGDKIENVVVEEVTPVVKQEAVESTKQEITPVVDTISTAIKEAIDNAKDVEEVKAAVKEELKVELKEAVAEETIEKMVEAVAAGKEIRTEIASNIVKEESVAETVKEKVEEVLTQAQNVAQYLDIEIKVQAIATDGAKEELGTMNELKDAISFSVVIPTELAKEGRTFFVLRIHNGVVDKLEVTENADGSYSFLTDKFSIYVLVYEDVKEPEVDNTPDSTPDDTPDYTPDNTPEETPAETPESKPTTGTTNVATNDKSSSDKKKEEVSSEKETEVETEEVETEVATEEKTTEEKATEEELSSENSVEDEPTESSSGSGNLFLYAILILIAAVVFIIARKKFSAK